MKKCSKCGIEKEVICFNKNKSKKSGYNSSCKECEKIHKAEYRKNNRNKLKEKQKIYRENNPEIIKQYGQKYYQENKDILALENAEYYQENKKVILIRVKKYEKEHKEEIKEKSKIYREEHKDELKEKSKIYREEHKKEINIYHQKYNKKRCQKDIKYKLRINVSSAITLFLKRNLLSKNGKSSLKYLPFTFENLKSHLELFFEPWMNWQNWGKYNSKTWNDNDQLTWKWQLDHIKPHSTFHYETMDCQEFRDCWALSNLRPLGAKQNQLDGATKIRHKEIKGIPIIFITNEVMK